MLVILLASDGDVGAELGNISAAAHETLVGRQYRYNPEPVSLRGCLERTTNRSLCVSLSCRQAWISASRSQTAITLLIILPMRNRLVAAAASHLPLSFSSASAGSSGRIHHSWCSNPTVRNVAASSKSTE